MHRSQRAAGYPMPPYGVMRSMVASDGQVHGFLRKVLDFCEPQTSHLRIEHTTTTRSCSMCLKNGFRKCGIIHLANGDPRLAYEKC